MAGWFHSCSTYAGAGMQVCGFQKSSQFCWGEMDAYSWGSKDVYFTSVDVALSLQCLFPMMGFAMYKFYLSRGLSFNIGCHYLMNFLYMFQ